MFNSDLKLINTEGNMDVPAIETSAKTVGKKYQPYEESKKPMVNLEQAKGDMNSPTQIQDFLSDEYPKVQPVNVRDSQIFISLSKSPETLAKLAIKETDQDNSSNPFAMT